MSILYDQAAISAQVLHEEGKMMRFFGLFQQAADDIVPGPSGVRAQALATDGRLMDDFLIQHGENIVHVLNAPSPAATSSLVLAQMIVDEAQRSFNFVQKGK